MESAFEPTIVVQSANTLREPSSGNLDQQLAALRQIDLTPATRSEALTKLHHYAQYLLAYASDRELHPSTQVLPGPAEDLVIVACKDGQTTTLCPNADEPSTFCLEVIEADGSLNRRQIVSAASLEAMAQNCVLTPASLEPDPIEQACSQAVTLLKKLPLQQQAELLLQRYESWAVPDPRWYNGSYETAEQRLHGQLEHAERRALSEALVLALPKAMFQAKDKKPALLRRLIEEELEELAAAHANDPAMPKHLLFILRKLNQFMVRHYAIEKLYENARSRYQNTRGIYGFENPHDRSDPLGSAKFCAKLLLGLNC